MLPFELYYKLQELRLKSERTINRSNDTSTQEHKVLKPDALSTANPKTPQNNHVAQLITPHILSQISSASSGGDDLHTAADATAQVSWPLPFVPFHSMKQHTSGMNASFKLHEIQKQVDPAPPDNNVKDKIVSLIRAMASTADTEGGIEAMADMITRADLLNEVAEIIDAWNSDPKFPIGPVLDGIGQIVRSTV